MRIAAALVLGLGLVATAQAKPPTLTGLEPSGARQGTTVLVNASGSFDHWPERAWTSAEGLVFRPTADKGKLWAEVGENIPPGLYWVRLHDDEGASALRPFVVGALPELREVEPNDDPARPQMIDRAAVTIEGKLGKRDDIDGFGIYLRRGEHLVASIEANRTLGSPMDGLLQIARTDGIVLAQNDDDHERDPQVVFEAPADGLYVVRTFAFPATPDSRIGYAGGSNYLYRLTLTTRAFVDHPYPLAAPRERPGEVKAEGWNLSTLDDALRLHPGPSSDRALAWRPGLANPAEVRLVDHAVTTETEPNGPDAPQAITPPITVSGRLLEGRDLDAYRFTAKKGERFLVRVESRALGQPLDPALRVLDASGKVVSEADDSGRDGRDAEINFSAPADGEYRAVVRDLNRQGGERAVYLLNVAPPKPSWNLTLTTDRFTLTSGTPLSIPVKVERTNGFDGVLEITAEGLPEGVTVKPAVSEAKGDSAKSVKLTIERASGEAPLSTGFRIVGRVKGSEGPSRDALGAVEGFPATASLWFNAVKAAPRSDKK